MGTDSGARSAKAASVASRIRERHGERVLLLVLLVALAVPKIVLSASNHSPGTDGGYYADIAAHVRDGDGLRTDISLLHKGYPSFPHPTDIYPLWPLLYGYLAKVFPLVPVGIWLSTLLYFTTLVGAYVWAVRVWPGALVRSPLNAGHVAVVVLGLATSFFEVTSLPYTEGLGYTLLTFALWRAHVLLPRRTLVAGLELGAWGGALVLARTQLVLFFAALGVASVAALVFMPEKRRTVVFGTGAAIGFAALLAPEYVFLRTFIEHASPVHLFRFDTTRFTSELPPFQVLVPVDGPGGLIADRAKGFVVAFASTKRGYWVQFHTFAYAPVIAAVAIVSTARLDTPRKILSWVRDPSSLPLLFLAIFVGGAFLSTHTLHKAPDAWYFHRRHALPSAFLLIAAMVYALRGGSSARWGRWARWTGLALFATGVVLGARQLVLLLGTHPGERSARPAAALVTWIEAEKKKDPQLILALRNPQLVAWQTDAVGYHWYDGSMPAEGFIVLADELGLDAVVVPPQLVSLTKSARFKKRFRRTGQVGRDQIYRPRDTTGGERDDDAEPDEPAPTDDDDDLTDPEK